MRSWLFPISFWAKPRKLRAGVKPSRDTILLTVGRKIVREDKRQRVRLHERGSLTCFDKLGRIPELGAQNISSAKQPQGSEILDPSSSKSDLKSHDAK
jgi:hypothetical protein